MLMLLSDRGTMVLLYLLSLPQEEQLQITIALQMHRRPYRHDDDNTFVLIACLEKNNNLLSSPIYKNEDVI